MIHINWLCNQVIPKLPHSNEGLIFTPVDLPYIPGLNKYLYFFFL